MSGINIPENWLILGFDDVFCQVSTSGKKVKSADTLTEGEFPVIDQGRSFISGYFNDSDLVISESKPLIIFGDHTREIKWIDFPFIPGADGVQVLSAHPEMSARYFYYFLRNLPIESRGYARHFKVVKEAEYLVPPLAEQTRIAAKLDELLIQVDTLAERFSAIPALLKRFRQSVLSSATSGRLTELWRAYRTEDKDIPAGQVITDGKFPESWQMRPLKKIAARIEQGWSPKCESVPARYDEWAVIKTTAIQPITFEPSENKKLPTALPPRPELTINKGDILITRAGPRSRAAICCYVRTTHSKLMICDKAYRFRTTEEEFSGLLLCYLLNSPQYVRTLDALKTGISESGVNLTMRKFQELVLPLPPREEQTEIVRRVEELFAFADQLEAKVASAKSRIDKLTQSILAEAFRGELVPQDPNDEPASALMARIKNQCTATPKAKRGRRAATPS